MTLITELEKRFEKNIRSIKYQSLYARWIIAFVDGSTEMVSDYWLGDRVKELLNI